MKILRDGLVKFADLLPEKQLWYRCLHRALLDALGLRGVDQIHKEAALRWIYDEPHGDYLEPRSYHWTCQILNLDPMAVRAAFERRKEEMRDESIKIDTGMRSVVRGFLPGLEPNQ